MNGSMDIDPSYFDCLSDDIIGSSCLKWSLRDYNSDSYMFANMGKDEIHENVISSPSVTSAITKVCEKEGIKRSQVEKKANEIIDEIAHTFNLRTIRFMAFAVTKIVTRLFKHVFINRSGIEKLSELVKFAPMVLVPSHNSYFDFLLASLVCFAVDLPLPAIASGQDFLHIAIVNRLLRGSGAFFLRRSFVTDSFYKSIFTEYVQQVIRDGRMPMEFFLEGTRSRSGKALHPKTGMLSMITELFFLGHVPDVLFCPLSISYECITEEQLYLFELLGIPKPKESLSGLLKARKVLSADYGTVHLHFGDLVSLKNFCQGSICRSEYTLFPRHQVAFRTRVYTKKEKSVVRRFAHFLVNEQQKKMMIYPRSIIAAGVLQQITKLDDLEILTHQIGVLLRKLGRNVYSVNNQPASEIIAYAVKLCSPVLQIDSQHSQVRVSPYEVSLSELKKTALGQSLDDADCLSNVLSRVYLSLQRNKLIHPLLLPSFVIAACHYGVQEKIRYSELLNNFSFILKALYPEFIRHPDAVDEDDLMSTLDLLKSLSLIFVIEEEDARFVHIPKKNVVIDFLKKLIRPFLVAYWLVGQFFIDRREFPYEDSKLPLELQLFSASVLHLGIPDVFESLSLHTIKNAIKVFRVSGCLHIKESPNTGITMVDVNQEKLHSFVSRLGDFAGLPDVWLTVNTAGKVQIKAKM